MKDKPVTFWFGIGVMVVYLVFAAKLWGQV